MFWQKSSRTLVLRFKGEKTVFLVIINYCSVNECTREDSAANAAPAERPTGGGEREPPGQRNRAPQRPGPQEERRERWAGPGPRGLAPRLFPEEMRHTGKRISEVSAFFFLQ